MKRYLVVFFLFLFSSVYSQSTINNYKYVIVPQKFLFLKEDDQYSLNSLTKSLLQAKGFTVFFDNELPAELANNKCGALSADVLDKSGMFSTTLTLVLKDCYGSTIFKSKPGKSREKDFSTGYNMALRDAFTSLDQVSYSYVGPVQPAAATTTAALPAVAEKQIPASAPVQQMAATTATVEAPIVTEKQIPATAPAKTMAATTAAVAPVVTEKQIPVAAPAKTAETNSDAGTLYAQSIPNGYQLVDNTPKKVLTLLKTSVDNYFIASNDTVNGLVLKINDDWFFEYYQDGKLVSKKLLVKF